MRGGDGPLSREERRAATPLKTPPPQILSNIFPTGIDDTENESLVYAIASQGMDKDGMPRISARNPILRNTRFSFYVFMYGILDAIEEGIRGIDTDEKINRMKKRISKEFYLNDCEQWLIGSMPSEDKGGGSKYAKLFGFTGHATAAIGFGGLAAALAVPLTAGLSIPILAVIVAGILGGAGGVGEVHAAAHGYGANVDARTYRESLKKDNGGRMTDLVGDIKTEINSSQSYTEITSNIKDLYMRTMNNTE
jgi:hypothetical protein